MWSERLDWNRPEGWRCEAGGLREPHLVFVFGDTDELASSSALHDLAIRFPNAIVLGCSTGTAVAGMQLVEGGVTALAVGFDRTRVRLAIARISGTTSAKDAGALVGAELAAPDLAGVFVVSGGLNVNGSDLVEGIVERIGPDAILSGGLAADGGRFGRTLVVANRDVRSDLVAAVGFYGDAIRIAHGSAGGWDEFGPHRTITRASSNVLFELDGRNALDLYKHYLGEEAAELPASALLYPLRIRDPAHPSNGLVRTVLSVDHAAGSMTFAGNMPEGWSAQLMRGSMERLIDGAAEAARCALDRLRAESLDPAVCLLVSCVGRRLLMGQRTQDEIDAVLGVLGPDVRQAGFYSYGEIGPHRRSGRCSLHNQTATLTLLAECS